jgi:hypothetical protein
VFLILFFGVSAFTFYTQVLPSIIKRDKSNEMLITKKESVGLYQYLESNYVGKEIGIDGSILYPYRHSIHTSPYHPFASERPKTSNIIIKSYLDKPELIWECSVVVFKDNYPPLLNSSKNSFNSAKVKELNSAFEIQTKTNFVLDTIIGKNFVYKKNK